MTDYDPTSFMPEVANVYTNFNLYEEIEK